MMSVSGTPHLPSFLGSSGPSVEDVIGLFLVTFALLGFLQVLSRRGEWATASRHPGPLEKQPNVTPDPPALSPAVFGEKKTTTEPSSQSPPPEPLRPAASALKKGQGDGKRQLSARGSSSPAPTPK